MGEYFNFCNHSTRSHIFVTYQKENEKFLVMDYDKYDYHKSW